MIMKKPFNGDIGYISDFNEEDGSFIFNEVVKGKKWFLIKTKQVH